MKPLDIVILGLTITSSWGNGHATTYRALVRALAARGHKVLFLERDRSWYAAARDLPRPPYCRTSIYRSLRQLKTYAGAVRAADLVIVGSYVPRGIAVGEWVLNTARGTTAFYDIDTPVTLALLEQEAAPYIRADMIRRYDLYLSFAGGPILETLERHYGAPMARPLYCAVDTELYRPKPRPRRWTLGYMGTYSVDRQDALERLLLEPARRHRSERMVVAGAQYPALIGWPENVERIEHVPPASHSDFYGRQSFTLNLTRKNMVHAGYSPSVRLFEAAACACPVISDWWDGLDQFFKIGEEILLADSPERVAQYLFELPPRERRAIGRRARARVLAEHTAAHRAAQLEGYIEEARSCRGAHRGYEPKVSAATALSRGSAAGNTPGGPPVPPASLA